MAGKTLIGGTAYTVKGGRTLIDGTGYSIKGGRTLVDGTGYDIEFYDYYTDINNVAGIEIVCTNAALKYNSSFISSGSTAISEWNNTYGIVSFSDYDIQITHSEGSQLNGYVLSIDGNVYLKYLNGERLLITNDKAKNAFTGSIAITHGSGCNGAANFTHNSLILGDKSSETLSYPDSVTNYTFGVSIGRYEYSGSCYSRVGISACTLNGVSIPVSVVNEIQ